jgi:hypothetical protein
MFVLMVAVLPSLLSDQPPEVPQRAGLGDRFHYFRGASGRRYLFSALDSGGPDDFHSAVVILARHTGGGRLTAEWIGRVDPFGRPEGISDRRWPRVQRDTVVLVHLLSPTAVARRDLVADLSGLALPLAA